MRTKQEFASGHVPDAIHIPYERIGEAISALAPNKDQPVRLYCASGLRSGFAARSLRRLGYTDATNEGGFWMLKKRFGADPPAEDR